MLVDQPRLLSPEDLLAGSRLVHDIDIPPEILAPATIDARGGRVRLRPLSLSTITLISRAAREDVSLIPVLMIKESMVEPALTLDQIRSASIGLVHYLVGQVNLISGLSTDGQALEESARSPMGQTHLLLAKHFGWTPEQVSQLTPGQVAVYLAGVTHLLRLEEADG
jgi:hypothetical protein